MKTVSFYKIGYKAFSRIKDLISRLEEEIGTIDKEENKDKYEEKLLELNEASLKCENLTAYREELKNNIVKYCVDFELQLNKIEALHDQLDRDMDYLLPYDYDIGNAYDL